MESNVNVFRLWDWIQMTVYYTIANTTLHHLYWFANDHSQIVDPKQFAIMLTGDVLGTAFGAWLLAAGSVLVKQLVRSKIGSC